MLSIQDKMHNKSQNMEVPDDCHLYLQALRDRMKTRPDITFFRKEDYFLNWFIQARKHDITEAFKLLVKYCDYRKQNKRLFKNLRPSTPDIKSALFDGLPGVLPQKDQNNRRVLVLFAANWDQRSYGLASIYRALWTTLEKLLSEEAVLQNGVVLIVDWCQFSFRQSANVQPNMLKIIVEGLQDCFPVHFQEIHFLNQPWYVDAMFKIAKNFMSPGNKSKVHLHGNNMATLCCYINEEILPAEFGGLGPPYHMHSWAVKMVNTAENEHEVHGKCSPPHISGLKRRSETFPLDHYTTETEVQKRGSTGANLDEFFSG